jgi:hypothetical protein
MLLTGLIQGVMGGEAKPGNNRLHAWIEKMSGLA